MKEVTYEEWIKNPTPRMMWCWDGCEKTKNREKLSMCVMSLLVYVQ